MLDFDKKPGESFAFVAIIIFFIGLIGYSIYDQNEKRKTPLERAAGGMPLGLEAIKSDCNGQYIIDQNAEYHVIGIASAPDAKECQYVRIADDLYTPLLNTAKHDTKLNTNQIDAAALEKSLPKNDSIWDWFSEHPVISILLAIFVLWLIIALFFD